MVLPVTVEVVVLNDNVLHRNGVVVDADGHIMEPPTLWENYVDSEYKANCIKVIRDTSDGDKLIINGVPSCRIPRLGGVRPSPNGEIVDWNSLKDLTYYESYGDSCIPASYDPVERLRWMDKQKIDVSILFPSLGLIWPNEVQKDPEYIRAHMWAYNRWIFEFSESDKTRLIPVAQTVLFEQKEAISDLHCLRQLGFAHIMLPMVARDAETCFHANFSNFWSAVQDLDFTVHLHKAAIPHQLNIPADMPLARKGNGPFFSHVNQILAAQMCLASIMDSRLPDRFSKIRFTFLECNAGWLPAWLDRADETFEVLKVKNVPLLEAPPRYYIQNTDRFFFGLGMTEDATRLIAFADRLLIATDFPHPDAPLESVHAWSEKLDQLPSEAKTAILGQNALRLLNLKELNYAKTR